MNRFTIKPHTSITKDMVLPPAPAKPPKYRNKITYVDGIRFDSKREADYYGKMKIMQRIGDFHVFAMQIAFPLVVNKVKICTYVADFVTYRADGTIIDLIDAKGFKTPEYRLKAKLMKACYGIEIKEV